MEATWTSWPQACMTPSTSEWTVRASSSWTGRPSMSPRRTTLRPGRPPSMVKMPPVSVVRSVSEMPSAAMWSRITAVVSCSAKASSGRRCSACRLSTMSSNTTSAGAGPNRSLTSPAQQVACDVGDLDLVGAGVDLEDLGVAGQLLHPELGHVPVTAEELHRLHGHLRRGLGRVQLHGRGLGQGEALAGPAQLDVAEDQVLDVQAGHLHAGQLELNELELGDGPLPEQAVLGVLDRELEAL